LPRTNVNSDSNLFFPAVDCEIHMPPEFNEAGSNLEHTDSGSRSVAVGAAKDPQFPVNQWSGGRISALRDIHLPLTEP
jgi:hypothetical protein